MATQRQVKEWWARDHDQAEARKEARVMARARQAELLRQQEEERLRELEAAAAANQKGKAAKGKAPDKGKKNSLRENSFQEKSVAAAAAAQAAAAEIADVLAGIPPPRYSRGTRAPRPRDASTGAQCAGGTTSPRRIPLQTTRGRT